MAFFPQNIKKKHKCKNYNETVLCWVFILPSLLRLKVELPNWQKTCAELESKDLCTHTVLRTIGKDNSNEKQKLILDCMFKL